MLVKLDAVNACLRGVGLDPVNSLESSDAYDAVAIVDLASTSLQARGWWFNKEYNWKLSPNAENKIAKPSTALDIISWNTSRLTDLTVRGNFIYDKYMHTYDLSDAINSDGLIEFAFILEIPFDSLPEVVKLAILYRAKRMYAQDEEADRATFEMQSEEEKIALVELMKIDSRHNKRNINHNPVIAAKMRRIGGYNSSTFSTSNYPRRDS